MEFNSSENVFHEKSAFENRAKFINDAKRFSVEC